MVVGSVARTRNDSGLTLHLGTSALQERRPQATPDRDRSPARVSAVVWSLARRDRAVRLHRLCAKPDDPKENFARVRAALAKCVDDPRGLTGRDVGMIRKVLASYVTRHGVPESTRWQRVRAEQRRSAHLPSHAAIAGVLAQRLAELAVDEGAIDVDTRVGPLSAAEAGSLGAPAGLPIPASLVAKAMRCLEAPLESLVDRGLVMSVPPSSPDSSAPSLASLAWSPASVDPQAPSSASIHPQVVVRVSCIDPFGEQALRQSRRSSMSAACRRSPWHPASRHGQPSMARYPAMSRRVAGHGGR